MSRYYLKDHVTDAMLEAVGFEISHVAVYPTAMVRIVNDKQVIEVCMEEPSYNVWSGEDWKQTKLLKLWECKVVKRSQNRILLEPNVKDHWYYERIQYGGNDITPYIKDLLDLNYVEVRNE